LSAESLAEQERGACRIPANTAPCLHPIGDFKARWRRAITDYLLLGHVLEDLHNLAIQQTEVADVFFDPGSRYLPQKLVEQPRRMTLEEAVFTAMPTLGQISAPSHQASMSCAITLIGS